MGAKIHTSAKICTGVEDIFLVHFCWAQIAPGLASKGPLGPTVSIERGGLCSRPTKCYCLECTFIILGENPVSSLCDIVPLHIPFFCAEENTVPGL